MVTQLAAGIFGCTDTANPKYARPRYGRFQLINVAHDVGNDARRGRIYIPMDELKQFNVPAADILNGKYSIHFTALMKFQTERAEKYYAQAFAQLPAVDRKSQRHGRSWRRSAHLLEEIKRVRTIEYCISVFHDLVRRNLDLQTWFFGLKSNVGLLTPVVAKVLELPR